MAHNLVNQVYYDPKVDLPTSEKALFAFLAHCAQKDGTRIFPGLPAMMQVLQLSRRQTLDILKSLKEKGYIVQNFHAGGAYHKAGFYIPLDAAGTISPRPISADELTARRDAFLAKYSRKRKLRDQVNDQADDGPPTEPQFPAISAALSTAVVPSTPPITLYQRQVFDPFESREHWPDQEKQRVDVERNIVYLREKRDSYPGQSRARMMWQNMLNDAEQELKELQATGTIVAEVEEESINE